MKLNELICYYLADPMGAIGLSPEEEMIVHQNRLKVFGTEINIKEYPIDQLGKEFEEVKFDILFFDWGGMALGNSIMEHYIRRILKAAEVKQSTLFILVSSFTHAYMEQELNSQGIEELPFNIMYFNDDLKKEADTIKNFFAISI